MATLCAMGLASVMTSFPLSQTVFKTASEVLGAVHRSTTCLFSPGTSASGPLITER